MKTQLLLVATSLASFVPTGFSQDTTLKKGEDSRTPSWLVVPYAFSSETWDTAFGVGGGGVGWPREYSVTYAAATVSTNESWNALIGGVGYPGLLSDRLFFDPFLAFANYTNLLVYVTGNPDFLDDPARAGSSDSNPDNFFRENTDDIWFQARFRYILPIGQAAESPLHTYTLDRGLLVDGATGGDRWDPLSSGRTSLLVRPYYRDQAVVIPALGDDFSFETANIQFALEYDNRNFRSNPSRGSYQMIGLTRDWGALGEASAWTFGEVELAKYFSLGANDWFRQQVLGFNAWTGYSFTWDEVAVDGLAFPVPQNRPPYYTGATLGGLERMRGYPSARFNGRSVIYYSMEYRVIPQWTPFSYRGFDDLVGMDWWQITFFAEAGEVADTYDLGDLHSNMKGDLGVDFRFMIRKAVLRLGFAVSDEGTQMAAMFGHPF